MIEEIYENGRDAEGIDWTDVLANAKESKPTDARVSFEYVGIENVARTKKAGHKIFDQVVHMRIASKDGLEEIVKVATKDHIKLYPRQYKQFLDREQKVDGFPLKEWPAINRVQLMNLNAAGIFSLEDLSDAPLGKLQNIGPIYAELQEKAKAYFAAAKNSALVMELTEQVQQLRRDNESYRQQLAQVNAMYEAQRSNAGVIPMGLAQSPSIDMSSLADMVAQRMMGQMQEPAQKLESNVLAMSPKRGRPKKVIDTENE